MSTHQLQRHPRWVRRRKRNPVRGSALTAEVPAVAHASTSACGEGGGLQQINDISYLLSVKVLVALVLTYVTGSILYELYAFVPRAWKKRTF